MRLRRLFPRGVPRPPMVGLVMALVALGLLALWWLWLGGPNAGTLHKHLPTEKVVGVPERSALKPLPAVVGAISAFDRSVVDELLRTRPSTRPLRGALRIALAGVRWDDAQGRPFVRADRISGRLALAELLRGNGVVSGVDAVAPHVFLYRTAGDTLWNYEHVLAAFLGPGPPGQPARKPGTEPLVEVRGLTVHDGDVTIVQPASARQPSYQMRFLALQAAVPRITFSAPHLAAPIVEVAQGSAVMERPDLHWHLPFTARAATVTFPSDGTHFTIAELAFGRTRLTDIAGLYDSSLPGLGVKASGDAPAFELADVKTFAPTLDLAGAGAFAWRIEPTADNGVLAALTRVRFASGGSRVAGAVTFTALGDTARPTLESADVKLQPLQLAFLERVSGQKLPYDGDLTGTVTGARGDIHFDVTGHLTAPGAPPFTVGLVGGARFAPAGVTLRTLVANLKSVPLAALRPVVPGVPLRGTVSGEVRVTGPPREAPLRLDVRLELAAGVALVTGTLDLTRATPSYDVAGRLLGVRLRDVVAADLPPVSVTGAFTARGTGFAPATATSSFSLHGRFSGWRAGPADVVALRGSVAGGVLRLDTLGARLATATLAAGGVWPYSAPGTGAIAYRVDVGDLAPFAPYLPLGAGTTAAGAVHLAGTAGGTLQAPHFQGRLTLAGVQADGWTAQEASGSYDLQLGATTPRIGVELQGRGIGTPNAGAFATLTASVRLQSPALSLTLDGRRPDGGLVQLTADGSVPATGPRAVTVQRLLADVGKRRWQLMQPAVVRWAAAGDTVTVQNLVVQEQAGPGRLALNGTLLPADASDYRVQANAIPVADFYQLTGQPSPVTGLLYANGEVHGPAAAPLVNGTFRLDSGSVQGVKLTQLQGTLTYRAGRLTADARALLAQGGGMRASAALPLALTLGLPPAGRLLPTGSVEGTLVADTVPLALLASVAPDVTDVSGVFSASMSLTGTSEQPALAGTAVLRGGALTVRAARQHYSEISGTLTLRDRRILVDSVRVRSDGLALLTGSVEFPELRNPLANLTMSFNRFRPLGTADKPQAAAWGQLAVTGPLLGPTIRGDLRLDDGNLLIPAGGSGDIVTEPGVLGAAELAPTPGQEAVPAAPLSNRLVLQGVRLTAGPNLWFEVPNARVQLSGTLTVDKAPDGPMNIVGTLEGRRGTYTVVAGLLVRRLDVTQARIRFLGTGDLNPEIDAVATKTILDPQARPIDIQARVTGTLDNPQLALSTAQGLQIPQSELLSFLVFGQPSFALGGTGVGQSLLQQTVFGGITEVASMQLQQSLMASGLPLDIFEIQPSQQGFKGSNLVVGRELAPDVFLTVQTAIGVLFGNTGQTTGFPIGMRLEWRMTPRLTSTLGYEPITPVTTLHGFFTTIPQQLRQDKQWTLELRRRWTY